MKQTIDQAAFIQAFTTMGRADHFSREGLASLFDYLEEVSPELELDVIAICCEFTEYDTALEAAEACGYQPNEDEDASNVEENAYDWLQDQTSVLLVPSGGYVISDF